jgi:GlcNAc-P-P-Und epimerase
VLPSSTTMSGIVNLTDCRILVTGGSGFIGTNLVESYLNSSCEILNIDINEPRDRSHSDVWRKVDLLDADQLKREIHVFQPHYIYHLAARTDFQAKTLEDYRANTLGVENLIQAISGLNDLQRIIFTSSRLVCKISYQPKDNFDYCPTTPYGESKVLGEKMVHQAQDRIPCPWLIVRPTSIWGPWFGIPYKTFFIAIASGRYFHPGAREIYKSFGYVGNSVYELDQLMQADVAVIHRQTFYLEDYPPINVRHMANHIQETLQVKKIRTLPILPLRAAGLLGDIAQRFGWQEPPLTSFRLNNLLTTMIYESAALEKVVGDLPFSMEDGIHKTIRWMEDHGELNTANDRS